MCRTVPAFIHSIDFVLTPHTCEAGVKLYCENDEADAVYAVLSGRLRSLVITKFGQEPVEEFTKGHMLGIAEVFTNKPRPTTVIAVRESELAKIPKGMIHYISHRFPRLMQRLIAQLGSIIIQRKEARPELGQQSFASNVNTIAIMAVSRDVPLSGFTFELRLTLNALKPALRLSADVVRKYFGFSFMQKINEHHLKNWLHRIEEKFPLVLYQCDYDPTPWTKLCIRRADCILIVAHGTNKPEIGPAEKLVDSAKICATRILVLLWPERTKIPKQTIDWLGLQGASNQLHCHVRYSKRMVEKISPENLAAFYENLASKPVDPLSDFSRLARILTNQAIGVVFSGGGAKGAAHIGFIRALQEANIPIDMVGGVSMGAMVGSLFCKKMNWKKIGPLVSRWFEAIIYLPYILNDITYAFVARFTGYGFNIITQNAVGKKQKIEDLWIKFFVLTANLSKCEVRVHHTGPLWCYVRASMTIAGYLPPLIDPVDDHLLVDGGYVNNLPANVMHQLGPGYILAVDVGSTTPVITGRYGEYISGFSALVNHYLLGFFRGPTNSIDIDEIQTRVMCMGAEGMLKVIKEASYCTYVRIPIDKYNMLSFHLFDEIVELGYTFGKETILTWINEGKLAKVFGLDVYNLTRIDEHLLRDRKGSFLDLSAMPTKEFSQILHDKEMEELIITNVEKKIIEEQTEQWRTGSPG